MQWTTLSVVAGILAVGTCGTILAAPITSAFQTQTGSGGSFVPPSSPPQTKAGSTPTNTGGAFSPPVTKDNLVPAPTPPGLTPPVLSPPTGPQPTATLSTQQEISTSPKTDSRKAYLRDARRNLAKGNLKTAEIILAELKAMGGTYQLHEDSPAKVEALISQIKSTTRKKAALPADLYDRTRAELLVLQAQNLLPYGEVELAEKLANEAKSLNVDFLPTAITPAQVLAQVATLRARLSTPPQNTQREMVLNLTAKAQLALDQGNINQAKLLIAQAKQCNVPESAFKPGDLRPWEVESRLNTTAKAEIAQVGFNAASQPATPAVLEDPAMPEGRKVFHHAMAAWRKNDKVAALTGFKKAWNYQDELTPQEKSELKNAIDTLSQEEPGGSQSPNRLTLDSIEQEQQLIYQRMSNEVFREQQVAERLNTQKNPRAALTHLESLRTRVAGSQLTEELKRKLVTIVDRRINQQQTFIENNLNEIKNDEINAQRMAEVTGRRERKVEVGQQVQKLVENFNNLMEEQRFPEAELLARQANELAPELDVVKALVWKSKFASRMQKLNAINSGKEQGFQGAMADVVKSSTPLDDDSRPLRFMEAENWKELSDLRLQEMKKAAGQSIDDIVIRNKLRERKIDARFEEKPLWEVLDLMGEQAGVNFNYDSQALAESGVSKEVAVTLQLREPISMEAALNNLLRDLNLTFTVKDEVVLITTPQRKSQDVYETVYYVADLVVPIPNFVAPPAMGPISGVYNPNGLGYANNGSQKYLNSDPVSINNASPTSSIHPVAMAQQLPGGGNGALVPGGPGQAGAGFGPNQMAPGAGGGAAMADFDPLIQLIQDTIDPQSWMDTNGGPGTINEFRANLSLVVSQTLENHERIQDLLESLRRLQDLQITIEVRFITLQDDFFERIGIDFDFDVEDASGLPQPLGSIPDTVSGTRIFGRDAVGNPTQDLDLSFTQDSFTSAVPTFGGFDVNTAANFGFAILSDIEVFFLIQASKGDTRSNITQAPKVTLFNGQTANINDQSMNPFVTSVEPVVGDFAAAQRPIITLLAEGTSLSVNAVSSDDRRFVRMTLTPFFSQIGEVDTFTFEGSTTSSTGTNVLDPTNPANVLQNDNSIQSTGTTVQLPVFAFTTVNTTVSVPDGGTVLLGGIKRLNEARNERGVPFLSNVPYVSRLFKNIGIGRESESLMLMVTPRIIIQDEEEIRQVGKIGGS
ncbi:MAG: hypothetical protein VX438_18500 [Planctomycetota bacterium]|nr:hypothetical protein [Planctomycetota bacterium]